MHTVTYNIIGLSRLCYSHFIMNSIDIGVQGLLVKLSVMVSICQSSELMTHTHTR